MTDNAGSRALFATLETAHEQVESALTAEALRAGVDPREIRGNVSPFGSPAYHLKAAEAALCRLYQQLAVALPGGAALDSGDVTDSIIAAIEAPPVERWNVFYPGDGPFFSVIGTNGRVVAMRVASRELAERIAKLPQLEEGEPA